MRYFVIFTSAFLVLAWTSVAMADPPPSAVTFGATIRHCQIGSVRPGYVNIDTGSGGARDLPRSERRPMEKANRRYYRVAIARHRGSLYLIVADPNFESAEARPGPIGMRRL